MTVGERIKNRRIELGLTQEELAKMMGYSGKSSVCKAETWGNDITTSKVNKFARVLNCSFEYLMGWESDPDKGMDDIDEKFSEESAHLVVAHREFYSKMKKYGITINDMCQLKPEQLKTLSVIIKNFKSANQGQDD